MKLKHPFILPLTGAEPCTQTDPEMFYEESGPQALLNIPILRKICADCPIINECAEHAIAHEEYGFWGGLTARERKLLRRKRRQRMVSPVVYNDTVVAARKAEQRKRERDDLRGMPQRRRAERKMAAGD